MAGELADKTVLVTGASKGIGLEIVRRAVADGAKVAGVARTITPELADTGALTLPADLSTSDAPAEVVRQAVEHFGRLDVLINNVGVFDGRLDGFGAITDEQWQATFEVNFFSAVRAIRAALPSLLAAQGAVVNVSSVRGRMPQPATVDYGAAKAALTNLGKALADELGPRGVRVNTVSPGPTKTPGWTADGAMGDVFAAAKGVSTTEFLDAFPANAGLNTGRFTEPGEVAELVLFLASGRARNISGVDYVIDGGQSKSA